MLSSDGSCNHALLMRVNKAWNKLQELKSIVYAKRIGLNVKGKFYEAYVRSCIICDGETWAMSVENMRKLERTETRMIRLMCAVRLQDSHETLWNRFGIESIGDVVRSSRLRWFEHVECKPEEDWVKKI